MRTTWVALVVTAVVACGSDGSSSGAIDASGGGGPDAKQFRDAPPTSATSVTIAGTASEVSTSGQAGLAGVTIEAFRNADEAMPIAMTTTDAQGNYTLAIQTNGEAIDGFLKATKADYKITYLYPPYPLTMDFNMASVLMVKPSTYDTLSNITTAMQQPGNGVIALIVSDGTNPVAGATVTSTPAPTPMARYNAMVGALTLPSANATSTYSDGVAYLFNLPPGKVTVSATKTGMTFASHGVKAWADQLTTTVIVP